MKHPLRLVIHVPLREKRDFRQTLVGMKHALSVSMDGSICTYDLLSAIKPRKGQEHKILEALAEQLNEGWAICVWDVERLMRELEEILNGIKVERPAISPPVEEAWRVLSSASEEQLIDLRTFKRFPGGHYVSIIAEREEFDFDALSPRRRRRLLASLPKERPVSEDFWGVLRPLIMAKTEAERAWDTYNRWVRAGRPRPPRFDVASETLA